jgi:hypothetical protein
MRPCLKKAVYKKGTGRVVQGVGPKFKTQYTKKKEERKEKERTTNFTPKHLAVATRFPDTGSGFQFST